jgi:hypothetical protein
MKKSNSSFPNFLTSAFAKFSEAGINIADCEARWSVNTLTPVERIAILLNDFGTEVTENGIDKWVDRGYAGRHGSQSHRIIAAIVSRFRGTDEDIVYLITELLLAVEKAPTGYDRGSAGYGIAPFTKYELLALMLDSRSDRMWHLFNTILDEGNFGDPRMFDFQWQESGPARNLDEIEFKKINVGILTDQFSTSATSFFKGHRMERICMAILWALRKDNIGLAGLNKFYSSFWEIYNDQGPMACTEYYLKYILPDGNVYDALEQRSVLVEETKWSFEWFVEDMLKAIDLDYYQGGVLCLTISEKQIEVAFRELGLQLKIFSDQDNFIDSVRKHESKTEEIVLINEFNISKLDVEQSVITLLQHIHFVKMVFVVSSDSELKGMLEYYASSTAVSFASIDA